MYFPLSRTKKKYLKTIIFKNFLQIRKDLLERLSIHMHLINLMETIGIIHKVINQSILLFGIALIFVKIQGKFLQKKYICPRNLFPWIEIQLQV